ncbi:MAG: SMC-Scp complex subunit ScpB, partial [Erysipelotrichaceae bacterium]|nr:SMC-Scp complex subunit ScpB [Erysipelotrichaceae bacterium]
AYNQPITRVEIEEIRGVSCEMMLKKLQARNLIREAGRLDTPGLPYTYEVTEQFMDTFSLKSLEELPKLPDYQKVSEEGELFD